MLAEAEAVIDQLDASGPSTKTLHRVQDRYRHVDLAHLGKRRQYEFLVAANALRVKAARESFWEFCRAMHPDFYKTHRWHLRLLCEILQALYEKRLKLSDGRPARKLMINMPPRHGKSRTLVLFCAWMLGRNQRERIIACAYNETLATDFSRYTRDEITRKKKWAIEITYSDIFPETVIKHGDASYSRWALEGQHFNYMGAGVGSGITGKGCTCGIVDDPIKDAEEAFSETTLEKKWQWYSGTFLSRQESGEEDDSIEIVNHTRWAEKDLCGRILSGKRADDWYVFLLEAQLENGEMLCPDILSRNTYDSLKDQMPPEIFFANYHQRPITLQGRLYQSFATYAPELLTTPAAIAARRIAYIDTADAGSDFLSGFVALEMDGYLAITDAIYTKAPMEITEPQTARLFLANRVNLAVIESNNGGRGFARNVQRLMDGTNANHRTAIRWIHQSENKQARIYSASAWVQQHVRFPANWSVRWPELYRALTGYQREGKNDHDDAPDALTGLSEIVTKKSRSATMSAANAIM